MIEGSANVVKSVIIFSKPLEAEKSPINLQLKSFVFSCRGSVLIACFVLLIHGFKNIDLKTFHWLSYHGL